MPCWGGGPRRSISLASWQTAQGPQQQVTRQSPHGSAGRLYFSRSRRRRSLCTKQQQLIPCNRQYKQQLAKQLLPSSFSALRPYKHGRQQRPYKQIPQSLQQPKRDSCQAWDMMIIQGGNSLDFTFPRVFLWNLTLSLETILVFNPFSAFWRENCE